MIVYCTFVCYLCIAFIVSICSLFSNWVHAVFPFSKCAQIFLSAVVDIVQSARWLAWFFVAVFHGKASVNLSSNVVVDCRAESSPNNLILRRIKISEKYKTQQFKKFRSTGLSHSAFPKHINQTWSRFDVAFCLQNNFLRFLDLFQKESVKTDSCRLIMEAFCRYSYCEAFVVSCM